MGRSRNLDTDTLFLKDRALVLLVDGAVDRLNATLAPDATRWTRVSLVRAAMRRLVMERVCPGREV